METKLKRGDRVTIFEDPFTEKKKEGEATVWRRKEWEKERQVEKMQVRFDGELGEPLVWRYVRMDKYSFNRAKVAKEKAATKSTESTKKKWTSPTGKNGRKIKACTAVGL